ncbi:hypothetical protein IPA_02970 [Ignicoccus pacificus DSM 13166]|uniref:Uncharacterized protein n=1 Tax=Ignicoccus pacificus DSM 13166 TaxID=940294 RepID=A0A977KA93_9CREN|nr:hypothetical protein IPA_02970 [Ignicoccus pacificus DSM 13166]
MRMDVEDLAKFLMGKGFKEEQVELLIAFLASVRKGWGKEESLRIAEGAVKDAIVSTKSLSEYKPLKIGVRAGEGGLGSRGLGDQRVHEALTSLSSPGDAFTIGDLVLAADGFHSRLNEVPLLMGFHATRAAMRDVMVAGGDPLATLIDVHVADDTDISYVLDVSVGAKVASEGCGARFAGGSTLRIGGDVVWGERVTGGSFAVGKGIREWNRFNVEPGDLLCSTVGKGGGTVTAIALYHGLEELADLTVNLDFCKEIRKAFKVEEVKGAFDWTNGGIVLDAHEISEVKGVKVILYDSVYKAVHPKLLKALEELNLDPLRTSVDSIVFISSKCPEGTIEIGRVEDGKGVFLEGKELEVTFRESPYTHSKRAVEGIRKEVDVEALLRYVREREKFLKERLA